MQLEFHKESIRKLAEQAYRSAELVHNLLYLCSSPYILAVPTSRADFPCA